MDVLAERTNRLALDDYDNDYDDDNEADDEEDARVSLKKTKRRSLLNRSTTGTVTSKHDKDKKKNLLSRRRRRRSSARFLQLHDPRHSDNDDNDDDGDDNHNNDKTSRMDDSSLGLSVPSTQDLGLVYQNAIRMTAENKITASNSWNLNLIDHMDRFLGKPTPGATGTTSSASMTSTTATIMEDTLGPITGVNFTKASCTLDASVKIYSYRVDDIHLTSYKVLANLNRTTTDQDHQDGAKKKKDTKGNGGPRTTTANSEGDEEPAQEQQRRGGAKNNHDSTLETNLANLNIHKLDAAFDIDPLFYKMTKNFDEGGAKGLLLANLGVSTKGCNIVFDSTLEDPEPVAKSQGEPEAKDSEDRSSMASVTIDVSTLQAAIKAALGGQSLDQLPLVPQLAMLREEYRQLDQQGFLDPQLPTSDRYAAPKEVEIEADRSIHIEAIERSRASQADIGRSLMAERDEDDSSFGDADDNGAGFAHDDFGGGDDDDDDDDDFENGRGIAHGDAFPVSFIHDGNHRFSSESFQSTFQSKQPPSQATILLEAIASGTIAGSQSNYEYFNKKALEAIQENNQWAGSAHWKKLQPRRNNTIAKPATTEEGEGETVTAAKKKRTKNKASASVGRVLIDIAKTSVDLKTLLKQPPKAKKGASHPLQMTKAAVSKATKNENLLPRDVGINVQNLTSLFSRPNTNVMDLVSSAAPAAPLRQVGFGGIETWGGNEDNSYGDDDQGTGFGFGGGGDEDSDDDDKFRHPADDFRIPELEGIRKVEKVRVGYATVAKQVDVKRLKTDLWLELERTFKERNIKIAVDDDDDDDDDNDSMDSVVHDAEQTEKLDAPSTKDPSKPLSFQQTVREMQESQSQTEVTLPFYFICILHLANEKGLALESTGLEDFIIHSS